VRAVRKAAQLVAKNLADKLWLVSLGPRPKLATGDDDGGGRRRRSSLVPVDRPMADSPTRTRRTAALGRGLAALPGLDRERLLLFGGWERRRAGQA